MELGSAYVLLPERRWCRSGTLETRPKLCLLNASRHPISFFPTMSSALRLLALTLPLAGLAFTVRAQPQTDTTFTWRSYSQTGTTQVQVYPGPPGDEEEHTIVLRELAENRGPSTVEDLQYLADLVGRHLGLDPTQVYWIVHWGAFSYKNTEPDGDKDLFLRATFNRTKSGTLGSPYWKVVSETEVRELTDRLWRN